MGCDTHFTIEYQPTGKVSRQMPVVANLVADLMNAGWPKGKEAPNGASTPAVA